MISKFFIGWTCDGTSRYYYGIFVTYPLPEGYESCLICCGVANDPPIEEVAIGFAAIDIKGEIEFR